MPENAERHLTTGEAHAVYSQLMSYVYKPEPVVLDFASAAQVLVKEISNRVETGWVSYSSPEVVGAVYREFAACGIDVQPHRCRPERYELYLEGAAYDAEYYPQRFQEKSLEHFIALELLALKPGDVFIDVASEHSPLPDTARRLRGSWSYSQDIAYPTGVNGFRIGGNACSIYKLEGWEEIHPSVYARWALMGERLPAQVLYSTT